MTHWSNPHRIKVAHMFLINVAFDMVKKELDMTNCLVHFKLKILSLNKLQYNPLSLI